MGNQQIKKDLYEQTIKLENIDKISKITTEQIATHSGLSRNTVSQYLNELKKEGIAGQIKTRPTNFFDVRAFGKKFFQPQKLVYNSLSELKNEQLQFDNVFAHFIGVKESMKKNIDRIITAVNYPPHGLPIIFSGSTGVGKSYLANLTYQYCLQQQILKADAPFITLNCAQYYHNPELLSGNLFGYAQGSFTGATKDFEGMLELANGGVLFLDECHRLDSENQEKLFSFMDTGKFQRMGENSITRKSNVRLLFATTENLDETFLKTFLRRIPVAIKIPDLKDRSKTEVQLMIFLTFINESKRIGLNIKVSPWIINQLFNKEYKGNVGELKNDIRLLCAKVYSSNKSNPIIIDSDHIGNSFLTELLTNNAQETIIAKKEILFTPSSNLTEFISAPRNEEKEFNNFVQKIINLEFQCKNKEIKFKDILPQITRESAILIDHIVYIDQQFHDETLKYLTNIVRDLFSYIGANFFIELKGNAIVAIANFIYRKNDFEIILDADSNLKIRSVLSKIKELYPTENQILNSFLNLIETKLDFTLIELHRLLILSYLISLKFNYKHAKKRAIILAHGFSTASSIADVVNRFLNFKIFDSFDMPLNVSIDQVKEYVEKYLENCCNAEGLVILVDMGSLMILPKLLSKKINIPVLTINNVSTQEALLVGELIQKDISIDAIAKKTKENMISEYQIIYPKIKKTNLIITTCHTGIGSAKQIQKFLINSLPSNINYKVEAIDFNYLSNYQSESPIFKQYNVQAIIGTSNPQIANIPFISLEQLVSTTGTSTIELLLPTLHDSKVLAEINNKLVKNLSIERLLSAVTILDVKKVIDSVEKMILIIENTCHITLTNNKKATLYVHISALIERLLRNERPLKYDSKNSEQRIQGIKKIKRSLSEIEATYGINVGEGELNYLYDIIFETC